MEKYKWFQKFSTKPFLDRNFMRVLNFTRWRNPQKVSEKLLFFRATSAYLHPKQKVLELEYYNLWKLLEYMQTNIEQNGSIEISAEISKATRTRRSRMTSIMAENNTRITTSFGSKPTNIGTKQASSIRL